MSSSRPKYAITKTTFFRSLPRFPIHRPYRRPIIAQGTKLLYKNTYSCIPRWRSTISRRWRIPSTVILLPARTVCISPMSHLRRHRHSRISLTGQIPWNRSLRTPAIHRRRRRQLAHPASPSAARDAAAEDADKEQAANSDSQSDH
jgi:hypothetical protein